MRPLTCNVFFVNATTYLKLLWVEAGQVLPPFFSTKRFLGGRSYGLKETEVMLAVATYLIVESTWDRKASLCHSMEKSPDELPVDWDSSLRLDHQM